MKNIFLELPDKIEREVFDDLFKCETLRIERILSQGQSSPISGWYDQEENEWVIVLRGAGNITFADGREIQLKKGDYLQIPSHTKHKVSWTDPDEITVWLALFYR
jgi:cupin 2 domain-containing protein